MVLISSTIHVLRTECQAVHFVSILDSKDSELVDNVLNEESISINAQDCTGSTVLMKASKFFHIQILITPLSSIDTYYDNHQYTNSYTNKLTHHVLR